MQTVLLEKRRLETTYERTTSDWKEIKERRVTSLFFLNTRMPFNNGRRSSSSERESSLTRSQPPRLSNLDEESTLESPSQPPPGSLATSPLPLSQQPTYPILPQPKIPLDSDTDADESSSTSWTINMRDRTERGRSTRPKRKHTLSMSGNNKNHGGYGTILNESTKTVIGRKRNDSLEGRPLLRQESVLKVRAHSSLPLSLTTRAHSSV